MTKKKEKNTITVNDAQPFLPITDNMHTGNWVKCRCQHAGNNYDPVAPDFLCKNWNGDSTQEPQPCPVEPADFMQCPYLVKTKQREAVA